eukprot:44880-Amphidinium_carterae.1
MSAEPKSLEDLRCMGAGELRRFLSAKGINTSGCIEKADYVDLAARVLKLDASDAKGVEPTLVPAAAVVTAEASNNSLGMKIPGTFQTELQQLEIPGSPSRSLLTDVSTSPTPSPS